ncbi:MAG: DUF1836 domain-containing protein [Cellulosilyticaceae bacterium]
MNLSTFHIPRFDELPTVPLYKEQVIAYLEEVMLPLTAHTQEKLLTPTMLNNYVKQKIVSPPQDKKYIQKHLAYLIVVCLLKQVFTLQEICELIRFQIDQSPIEPAYDYFCIETEKALAAVFDTRDFSYPSSATVTTLESELLRSVVMSFAHKLFTEVQLSEITKHS